MKYPSHNAHKECAAEHPCLGCDHFSKDLSEEPCNDCRKPSAVDRKCYFNATTAEDQ